MTASLLVPQDGRADGAQVPETMGIQRSPQWREVQQLQAHHHHEPGNDDTGPDSPGLVAGAPLLPAEVAPERVLHEADDHVRGHVVRVVPAPQLEIGDVGEVERAAEDGPEAEDALAAGGGAVEAEDADGGVVHAVEDAGAGGEVVELLGEAEVADVEDGAEDPGGHAEAGEEDVVGAEGVGGGDGLAQLGEAVLVRDHVAEAEEDGEGLLHAEHPNEGPLAVELRDGLARREPPLRHDMLARVVAFLRAGPEEEAVVEGCEVTVTKGLVTSQVASYKATYNISDCAKRTDVGWIIIRVAVLAGADLL